MFASSKFFSNFSIGLLFIEGNVTVNYQDVVSQIKEMGADTIRREKELKSRLRKAQAFLSEYDEKIIELQQKIDEAVSFYPKLRCAKPYKESLRFHRPLPDCSAPTTIISVDGSQIYYDHHSEVRYALINIGAFIMPPGASDLPQTVTESELIFGERLFHFGRAINKTQLEQLRDFKERDFITKLAQNYPSPSISLTDGPLEIWGMLDDDDNASEDNEQLSKYENILNQLRSFKVVPAGFIDNPGMNYVSRMLELTLASQEELTNLKTFQPLQGVSDIDLYKDMLPPGERSAIFLIQSFSVKSKALEEFNQTYFFYVNINSSEDTNLVRVEIPAWVAHDPSAVDCLHSALIKQSNLLGNIGYPYALLRAHEIAVVTFQEKEYIDQIVARELRQQGIVIKRPHGKQRSKNTVNRRGNKR